jgi:hypothetical protein
MLEVASAAEFAIEPRDREIASASAIVERAKRPPEHRSWLLFASLPIRCIGRRGRTLSQVLMLLREAFAELVGHRSPIGKFNGPNISLAINSLDDPESVRPEWRFSVRTQVSWCSSLSSLATREMEMTDCAGFVSYQYRGRAANQC